MKNELKCAMVDARLVVDLFCVLVACHTAVSRLVTQTMVSKSVHTEILYHLSGVRNVGRALQLVGAGDGCSDVLFVVVDGNKTDVSTLREAVEGEEDTTNLEKAIRDTCDEERVRNVFQVSSGEGLRRQMCID